MIQNRRDFGEQSSQRRHDHLFGEERIPHAVWFVAVRAWFVQLNKKKQLSTSRQDPQWI